MTWLLQPPPLLAVGVVLAVAALVLERGVGLRRLFAALTSAAPAREESEVWGTPDPAPPAKQPFDYGRLSEPVRPVRPVRPVEPAPSGNAPLVEPAAPTYSRSIVQPQPLLEEPPARDPSLEPRPEAEPEPDEVSLADIFTRAQRRREERQEPES